MLARLAGAPALPLASAPLPAAKPSSLVDTRVIYCGDNLDQLKNLPATCVDLIYIAPPFNSNRNCEVFWGETKEKSAFSSFPKWGFGNARLRAQFHCGGWRRVLTSPPAKQSFPERMRSQTLSFGTRRTMEPSPEPAPFRLPAAPPANSPLLRSLALLPFSASWRKPLWGNRGQATFLDRRKGGSL